MQIRFFILACALFFAGTANALEMSAVGPGISSSLILSENNLFYRDKVAKISFPLASCERKQFERIVEDISFYIQKPDKGSAKNISILINGKKIQASEKSKLVEYLKALRFEIHALRNFSKGLCR